MKCAERNLLEFVQQPDKVRVDREKRMIFGLKLAGTESQNSHGEDADGTDYTLNAYRKAKHLYEGAPGYWGHPPRATPNVERSPHEKILTYCDVEVREDGVYGNAKYLESHPHTPLLLEAVEKDPGWFALSHNATGRGPVRNRRYVIEEIGRVKSVDVVCQGATNRTLFESQESDMPTVKFKVIPACFTGKARERYTKLLEADDYMSEVDVPATPEGGGTADEHLSNAAKAIFDDGSLDASQKLAKLKLLLKINDEADAKTDEPDGDEIDKAVAESLAKVEARTEGMLDLFESVGYVPTKVQRKALKGLESSEQKELLESFKAAKAGGRRERGGPGLPLMESKEEKGGEKPTFDKAAAINRFNGSLA